MYFQITAIKIVDFDGSKIYFQINFMEVIYFHIASMEAQFASNVVIVLPLKLPPTFILPWKLPLT